MAFAFRRRYNLPPTDPRYLDATPEEVAVDYFAHLFFENPQQTFAEDESFDPEAVAAQWAEEDGEDEDLPDDFEEITP